MAELRCEKDYNDEPFRCPRQLGTASDTVARAPPARTLRHGQLHPKAFICFLLWLTRPTLLFFFRRFRRPIAFHGTDEDTAKKIMQQGFNRNFSGLNATYYGKGVYFARDASYSASTT